MDGINLLPHELEPSRPAAKMSAGLKKMLTVGYFLFIVSVISVVAAYVFLSRRLSNLDKDREQLKSEIVALDATEQRLVLTKDRLQKIKSIMTTDTIREEAAILADVNEEGKGIGLLINSLELLPDSTRLGVFTPNSAILSRLVSYIKVAGGFKEAVIESIAYDNAAAGYAVIISLKR